MPYNAKENQLGKWGGLALHANTKLDKCKEKTMTFQIRPQKEIMQNVTNQSTPKG